MKNGNTVNIGNSEGYERSNRQRRNQRKRAIHTTLKPSDISKLEEYGDGRLNTGIERVLEIAESKQFNVKEQLIKIASQILVEEEMQEYSSMN